MLRFQKVNGKRMTTRTKRKHVVGPVSEIPSGTRKLVEISGRSIGVFNVRGRFFALRNSCPHQGGPLCLGYWGGTTLRSPPGEYRYGREEEIIRCPWHGWEFDLTTGKAIVDDGGFRVSTYEVRVERPSVDTYDVVVEDDHIVLYV